MLVLGLDPSLTNYGWAVHDTDAPVGTPERCVARGRFGSLFMGSCMAGRRGATNTPPPLTPQPVQEAVMVPYLTPPKGGGIYVIRLSDTHYYGGRTKCFRTRWAVHRRLLREGKHFNPRAQAVFNQHGRFEPEVLCVISVDGQRAAEKAWLDENFDKPGCVNLSRSSDGVHAGYKHSEETRAKHRRPIHTPESKEKCRQAASKPRPNYTPHPHTEESRRKLSDAARLQHQRERLAGITRSGFSGRTHTAATRELLSQQKMGKPHPHKGSPQSEERKAHQAQKMREWWAALSPEERQVHADKQKGRPRTKGMTGRKHSPETKRKMAEARKRYWARKKAAEGSE